MHEQLSFIFEDRITENFKSRRYYIDHSVDKEYLGIAVQKFPNEDATISFVSEFMFLNEAKICLKVLRHAIKTCEEWNQ